MKVRKWTKSDLIQISNLEKECFEDFWTLDMFESTLNTYNTIPLLCEIESKIAGYILVAYVKGDDVADLMNIAVKKNFRRKGIADKLIENAVLIAKDKGIKTLFLEVRVGNIPAQNLYKKHNFKATNVREKYYDNQEDALVMAKSLED